MKTHFLNAVSKLGLKAEELPSLKYLSISWQTQQKATDMNNSFDAGIVLEIHNMS